MTTRAQPLPGKPLRDKPHLRTALLRFAVVGALGTLVNLAVLELLHGQLGYGFTRSSAAATEVAIIGNYLGNELWTFHYRRLSLRRLLQFNATMLVGAAVQVGSATLLKEFLPYLLAQTLGIGIGAAVNFAFNFGWTWRR
ncbi:MAG: GtrA family protein [Actinomycetota bacterium]|nr:GtrA family protein [Euzebyales bacterium]MDQ3344362.1 GtrA family protein [Actinomycetota bacterium]MDQ3528559.1 GtrA family protein [Actinomycetota bacterium]